MQIKYIDLFAGVGGFHLGIKKVFPDWECVYSNEWDKYANSVYRKHYGECDNRDIRTVDATEIPDFDLLCGGFPCQSFSIAGKRGGFSDTRGTLFFEIARIAKQKQPRLLLLENVKGLLSHDQGHTFSTIIATLDELGYDCQWQVLNSKDFGVPQNRERVFIVGHTRGTPRPKVFPLGGTNTKDIVQLNQPTHSNDRIYGENGLSPTLNTMQGGRRQPFVAAVLTPDRTKKRQNGRRMKTNGEPSFTLTGQDIHGVMIGSTQKHAAKMKDCSPALTEAMGMGGGHVPMQLKDAKIRRLTPVECEKLQGFPPGWTSLDADNKPVSDTQRYKMMGNAVTTNVITAIITKMYAAGTPTE